MKGVGYKVVKFLSITAFIISLFFVPYFYKQRLTTGVFKTDFYLIWSTGCLCWLYNALYFPTGLNRLGKVSVVACVYVLLLCFLRSFPDENSIYAVITLVCLVGIVCYLQIVFASKYYLIVTLAVLVAYFVQTYIGYLQAFENNAESLSIKGALYNSGIFANYLAGLIPLFLFGSMNKRELKLYIRIVFLSVFIAAIVLLSLTMARAALIGSALGCLFVMFSFTRKSIIKRIAFVFITSIPIFIFAGIKLYKLKPASALGRLTIYKVSINVIKDYPLLGVGPNRFSAVYNNYQASYFKNKHTSVETQLLANDILEAYNSLTQILVEYGMIGILFLICFAYLLIKRVGTQREVDSYLLLRKGHIGCIISIIISSFFSNPFHATPILLLFAYHLAAIFTKQQQSFSLQRRRTFFLLILVTGFSFFIFYYAIKRLKAESNWYKASELAKYDDFVKASKLYEEAYPFLKFNGDFLFNYGAESYLAEDYALSIKLLNESQHYNSISNNFLFLGDAYSETNQFVAAEQNYLKALYISPSRVFPKYKLIKLYKKWGKLDQAKYWTALVLRYPIKIESEFVEDLIKELKEGI